MAFQYIMTWVFCYFYVCVMSFTIGSSLTLIAVTKDLIAIIKSINKVMHDEKNQLQTNEQLNDFIKLHSSVKQLSKYKSFILFNYHFLRVLTFELNVIPNFSRLAIENSDIMQPSNVIFYTWCIVQICAKLLVVQMEIVEC